jgi:hypothetical protein
MTIPVPVIIAGGDLILNTPQGSSNTVSVDLNGGGGELVTLNGEDWSFASGVINQVTVNLNGDYDTVNILNTTTSAPVTVNDGAGIEAVTISPFDQELNHIQGNVTVNGGSGYDTLTIDDQNDSFYPVFTMTGSTFARNDSALVSYSAINLVTINGGINAAGSYNVQDTEARFTTNLNTGSGGNIVYVHGTSGPLNVGSNGGDTVNVGNAGSVQGILGELNIDNPLSFTTVNIDDSADTTARTVTLDTFTPAADTPWGSVTGLAPASINYRYGDTQSVSITTGSGADTVNVHATGVTTNLSAHGLDTIKVGKAGSVRGIFGALNIEDPPYYSTLTVDDSADPIGRTVTLNTFTPSGDTPWDSITGLASAVINYEQDDILSPVTINGGPGGNTFNVVALPAQTVDLYTGGGNDKVNVETTSGSLVVNGQGGTNTLVGPNANETWHITGTNAGNVGGVSFSNVQNLIGGTGNDLFIFSNGKGLTGTINGGGGTNELDYAPYTSAVTVNLASHNATGTGGFANIQTLVGGSGSNTLVGPNATNTWNITGTNAGNVAGVSFSAFPNLTGGTGMDVFKFSAGKGVTGAINGGGGGDWLDYASYTTPVTVNLATGAATGVVYDA